MPSAAHTALNATLAISLLQTTGHRSSKIAVLKPAWRQTSATRSRRGVMPPLSSARLIASMPLWWTWPGAWISAPNPPAIPNMMRSGLSTRWIRSTLPSPFWIVRIRVSGPIIGPAARRPGSMSMTLVATTTSSHDPASAASVVAFTGTVRSPLAPVQRSPCARIASTCSCHLSNSQSSLPPAASSAP
jgi:hypothetical protein